ncbi:hypothetical protein F8M41_013749 [Gigaspora margarita]|uniref:Uncharacterized protein n=1 Tax=Gigaspora margarita TaxID=4874 RepID=A0A8H4B3S3_GIGMA|nr:hypothetical protein F8M41_013749 [Gigaspora margarita]
MILNKKAIKYSIHAQPNHPLAKLWGINDIDVPEWLDAEKYLIMIDGILRQILAEDNFIASFGGTYIDKFKNCLVVNTVDYSKIEELLALPKISPYNESLHFENVTTSIKQLKDYFQEITLIADKFINAVEPFNPKIIYATTQSVSQNMIRPRRRDVNSRDLDVKYLVMICTLQPQGIAMILRAAVKTIFFYSPWNSNSLVLPIGPIRFESRAVIRVDNENLDPQFVIRNDDANQYKELIIINDGTISSHYAHVCKSGVITHLTCGYALGDAGGPVFSFASEENLHSVDVYGIVVTVGLGICAVQSLDTILLNFRAELKFLKIFCLCEGS